MLKLKGTYPAATLKLLNRSYADYDTDRLTPIDPEIKVAWVAALRSDAYKQDSSSFQLVGEHGHCCLGVLCDILPNTTWKAASKEAVYIDPASKHIPAGIAKTIGLTDDAQSVLSDLNDADGSRGGMNFDGIADFIEIEL